jgi:hypothetical protein
MKERYPVKLSWTSFWLAAAVLLPLLAVIACWDWLKEHRPGGVSGPSEKD